MSSFKRINFDFKQSKDIERGRYCPIVTDACISDKTDNCSIRDDCVIIDSCRRDPPCGVDFCIVDTCGIPILL